jgi:hypothetical protein
VTACLPACLPCPSLPACLVATGATHNANSKVQMSLSKGAAVLPDLHVSGASAAQAGWVE